MPAGPGLAFALRAILTFVTFGVTAIGTISAVGFSNGHYTEWSPGTPLLPPRFSLAVDIGPNSIHPTYLCGDADDVQHGYLLPSGGCDGEQLNYFAPTATLPLKISYAAPSVERPKPTPAPVVPSPTSTAPTSSSDPLVPRPGASKVEVVNIWCKNTSESILAIFHSHNAPTKMAALVIACVIFFAILATATVPLFRRWLPSLTGYLTKGNDLDEGMSSQGQLASKANRLLESLVAILRGRPADPTVLALAIHAHMDAERARRAVWEADTQRKISAMADARLAEAKVAQRAEMYDKFNNGLNRAYVARQKIRLLERVQRRIDAFRNNQDELDRHIDLLLSECGVVMVPREKQTSQEGEVQQPVVATASSHAGSPPGSEEREEETQQPELAQADSEHPADQVEQHEDRAAQDPARSQNPAEVAPEAKEGGVKAQQPRGISGLGKDIIHPKRHGSEGAVQKRERSHGLAVQTTHLEDHEENFIHQQREDRRALTERAQDAAAGFPRAPTKHDAGKKASRLHKGSEGVHLDDSSRHLPDYLNRNLDSSFAAPNDSDLESETLPSHDALFAAAISALTDEEWDTNPWAQMFLAKTARFD